MMTSQASQLPDPPFTVAELNIFMNVTSNEENMKNVNCEEMSCPDWLRDEIWKKLLAASNCLDGVCEKISSSFEVSEFMKTWFLTDKPEVSC